MEIGSPLGVLDQPHRVANQVDLNVLLTIGTWDGQILKQVGDAYTCVVQYEGLCDFEQHTDPIRIPISELRDRAPDL